MARVPYLDVEDLPEEERDLLKRPINLFRAFVHSPKMARAFSGLGGHIRYGSKLDPRLRELAILTVGYLTRSRFEYSHHVKLGMQQFGVTEDDLKNLAAFCNDEAVSGLSDLDRCVLSAAWQLTDTREIDDATFAALADALPRDELIDLVVAIAFYNGVVRILGALQIDVEDEYKPYLDIVPLPEPSRH
jgi:alkylhydroperoxidase family enzyme